MEIKEKITLDKLTIDSVSILSQQYITINGEDIKIDNNIRNAYMNTKTERELLKNKLADEYYNAIMAMWGDTPTITEPEVI